MVRATARVPRWFFNPLSASFLIEAWVIFFRISLSNPPPWIMKFLMTRWKTVLFVKTRVYILQEVFYGRQSLVGIELDGDGPPGGLNP